MTTPDKLLFLFSAGTILFAVRFGWYLACCAGYLRLVQLYCADKKIGDATPYLEVYPFAYALAYYWETDFRAFIVNQALFDKVMTHSGP